MLLGKVDVVVTDSPLLLGIVYSKRLPRIINRVFRGMVKGIFETFDNLNIFVNRVAPYDPSGRIHTEAEADALKQEIYDLSKAALVIDGDLAGYDRAVNYILENSRLEKIGRTGKYD